MSPDQISVQLSEDQPTIVSTEQLPRLPRSSSNALTPQPVKGGSQVVGYALWLIRYVD